MAHYFASYFAPQKFLPLVVGNLLKDWLRYLGKSIKAYIYSIAKLKLGLIIKSQPYHSLN
jgi:predicted Na+-dependent transporter